MKHRGTISGSIVLAIVAFLGHGMAAGQSPLWGALKPGPYAVGYRLLWKRDFSRTWQNAKELVDKSNAARPVRISVWYPAIKRGKPMPYGGYLQSTPPDSSFADYAQNIERYDVESVKNYFKTPGLFDQLRSTPTAAFKDAGFANGHFPLVVYSLGQNDHTLENTVLWEYLASYGFVVATVPDVGNSPRRFQLLVHDPLLYETQVRDLEFALQVLHDVPVIDPDRLAMMGHSFGGIYSLLAAMRNTRVDALIGLDPTYISQTPAYYYRYWEARYYDAANLAKVPILVLYKGIEPSTLRFDLVDNLTYSDRYLVNFTRNVHGDFNSSPMITSLVPDGQDYSDRDYQLKFRSRADGVLGYETACRLALAFLEKFVRRNVNAPNIFEANIGEGSKLVEKRRIPGLDVPTEEQFFNTIEKQGIDAAVAAYRRAKSEYPDQIIIREAIIKRIGNECSYYGQRQLAVDVFKLYVEAYPTSSDAYASLAEAYEGVGNPELAASNYEKALRTDPTNVKAKDAIKRLKGN